MDSPLRSARTESYQGIFRNLGYYHPSVGHYRLCQSGSFYPIGTPGAVPGRAAAMYINPTRAAEAILLTCLLAIPITRLQYRMPLLLLAGAGIIVTFSRGAILVWILFLFFLLITRRLPRYSFVFPLVALAVLPLLISIFTSYIQERQGLDNVGDNIFASTGFLQTQSVDDDSAQQRMAVLEAGWRIFLENPILGAGTGITSFQSNFWPLTVNTHNQIVMVAAEQGIIGIALWVWLIVILWRGRYFQDTSFQLVRLLGHSSWRFLLILCLIPYTGS